jgi:ATP-binding cassette subfamily F protein 3
MEQEMEALTHKMAELDPSGAEYAQVADRFHELDSEFRTRDGYAIEAQVGTVLAGLGFPHSDWHRRTEEFSGGWQMRIALAKLLLEKPNLLLLDEPTNHLDLEARNWLEQYLNTYPFAYVLISHDRYFLDVTVKQDRGDLESRRAFLQWQLRENTWRRNRSAPSNWKRLIATSGSASNSWKPFINRFRYQATKAKQVQSRIKELDKIERIELPEEEKTIHFSFPQPKASGRIVAEFQNVSRRATAKNSYSVE